MNKITLLLLLVFVTSYWVTAQPKVRYTDDFYFERGVYPTMGDWKAHDPVKAQDIITDLDPASPGFFQELFQEPTFRYPKNNEIVRLRPDEIFGYAQNGQLFYRTNYRFETIGAIGVLREVDLVDAYSSFIKPGESYEAAREEGSGDLYIFDYETGDFFKCKAKKLEAIFQRDAELYQEYKSARGKKSDRIKRFIKEYNFRHPIYFPKKG